MVGKTPPTGPTNPNPVPNNKQSYGVQDLKGFNVKPMTFLGMHFTSKEAGQLWQIIEQSCGRAIEREKERMLKALKKIGGSDQ